MPFDDRVMSGISSPAPDGCRYWTRGLVKGYGKTSGRLIEGGRYRELRVGRLLVAWKEKLDYDDQSWQARHSCDVPQCCELDHLLSGTKRDNMNDMVRRGRQPRGRWKLCEEQVVTIREMRAQGIPRDIVAAQFGLHPESITRITAGRSWK